jgi:hypothetical protein
MSDDYLSLTEPVKTAKVSRPTVTIGGQTYSFLFTDLFRPLTEEEQAGLEADVKARGQVIVPVVVDEAYGVIDGCNRLAIAERLGIKHVPFDVRPGLTHPEKVELAHSLNENRRQLTADDRKALSLLLRQGGMSYRAIGQRLGVHHDTVRDDIVKATVGNPTLQPDRIIGRDGKLRPAVFARNSSEVGRVVSSLASIPLNTLPEGIVGSFRISQLAKQNRHRVGNRESPAQITEGGEVHFGDFEESLAHLPDGSVSLLLTDPPYGEAFLPLWDRLGRFAAHKLRPGGLLVAYSGTRYLPTILASLATHLSWVHLIALRMQRKSELKPACIHQSWKPLLVFNRPPLCRTAWVDDVMEGAGAEKSAHAWQQPEEEAARLVKQFSESNELVLDPFVGSGTCGVAAVRLGRRFTGADIDPAAVATARSRLETARPVGQVCTQ